MRVPHFRSDRLANVFGILFYAPILLCLPVLLVAGILVCIPGGWGGSSAIAASSGSVRAILPVRDAPAFASSNKIDVVRPSPT